MEPTATVRYALLGCTLVDTQVDKQVDIKQVGINQVDINQVDIKQVDNQVDNAARTKIN